MFRLSRRACTLSRALVHYHTCLDIITCTALIFTLTHMASMVPFVDHCPCNGIICHATLFLHTVLFMHTCVAVLFMHTCVAVLFMHTCVAVFLTGRVGGIFTLEYVV